MKSAVQLVEVIHQRGGKATPQRLLIYQLLEGNDTHPTAEAIFSRVREVMPTVSLTTVYKTLNELVAVGELKRLEVEGVSHFDPNTTPHAEAVCLACGKIVDVPYALPRRSERLGNFTVMSAALTFQGYCSACRSNGAYPSGDEVALDG